MLKTPGHVVLRRLAHTLRSVRNSSFSREAAATLATRLIELCLALVVSVLVTRALGPAGRGELATIAFMVTLGTQFGNLGLHSANVRVIGRKPELAGRLAANSVVAAIGFGAIAAAAIWLAGRVQQDLLPEDPWLTLLGLLAIPVGLMQLFGQHLLLGLRRIAAYNLLVLTGALVPLAGVLMLHMYGTVTPRSAFGATLAGTVAGVTAIGLVLSRTGFQSLAPAWRLLFTSIAYGIRIYVLCFCSALVLRMGLFFVRSHLGIEAAGQYSVAAALCAWVMILPSTCGMLLFSRLVAAGPHQQWHLVRRGTPALFAVMAVSCGFAACAAPWAIPVLYGPSFRPAVGVFLVLMPAAVFSGTSIPAYQYLGSIGVPRAQLILELTLVALTCVGNWAVLTLTDLGLLGPPVVLCVVYLIGALVSYQLAAFCRRACYAVAGQGSPDRGLQHVTDVAHEREPLGAPVGVA